MGCAMGLIALGVGYLVLLNANKEKEGLKLLGQALGILIMIAALLSSLCMVMKCGKSKCHMDKSMCKMSMESESGAPMCPVSPKHGADSSNS